MIGLDRDSPQRLLVLAGGGHTHALLLRRWLMRPASRPAATLVVLINRSATALYSGLVPALVAGLVEREACEISLLDLCRRAGVWFMQAEITGLEPQRRLLQLQGRPPLRYDQLSLDLGAQTPRPIAGESQAMAVKPLEPFLAWLAKAPPRLHIRGGGAAAVELALALRLRGHQPVLLLRGDQLSLGTAAANRRAERWLARARIGVHRGVSASEPADLLCTGSQASAWLAGSGLPVDAASGRVLTDPSLVVQGWPGLFAVGDCALIAADPRPASGVWAVRAAPTLAANLKRSLEQPHAPLRAWKPQRRALQLLGGAAADQQPRALALYGPWALGPSRWLWQWKQRIDQAFMASFRASPAMAAGAAMVCRGCAAKLPASPLAAALQRLDQAEPRPEDAVRVVSAADGDWLLQSVDGFPALLDDPWLNARLTTLHASSDLWACGAALQSVQALVTLPQAAASIQEELLLQTLAGVRSVLDPLGVPLLGGHTLEGRDGAGLALALTVNGTVPPQQCWPKGPLPADAALVLSRPIGSGVLFAAAMAGAAAPAWIEAALITMQQCQAGLVEPLVQHGCMACTDVTGFGLLGHLGEMLGPGSSVLLDADAIPAHAGALALLEQGYASSLAPSNASALALLDPAGPVQLCQESAAARLQLLIDPQTCGPLLAAVPVDQVEALLAAWRDLGFAQAACVGRVLA